MVKKIDLTDQQAVEDFFRGELKKRLDKAMKYYGKMVADHIVDLMTNEVEQGDFETAGGTKVVGAFNTGELMRSLGRKVKRDEILVGSSAEHSVDVEFGLTPAEAKNKVTFDDIHQWVLDKKIASGNKAYPVAQAILNNIYKWGVSPRPFMTRALAIAKTEINKIKEKAKPGINKIIREG